MENRIEFYPEWREGDSYGVVAWASWNLNGDTIVEYIESSYNKSKRLLDRFVIVQYSLLHVSFKCLVKPKEIEK